MKIREGLNSIFQKEFTGRINYLFIIIVFLVYLFGQLYIGAYHPIEKVYRLEAVFHMDFLNYASGVKQYFNSFPPPNPFFSGVPLTRLSFHQLPTALLSQIISPILAIRVFNLLWVIVFILILRRYFPSHYGLLSFLLLCLSTPGWTQNPLGIDLIIRSFHHTPFFICLAAALFEKNKFWRYFSLIILPWIHIILFLGVFVFFFIEALWERKKDELLSFLFITIGLFTFNMFLGKYSSVSLIPLFLSKIDFKIREPLVHILPFIAFICYCNNKRLWLLGGIAFILAAFIQWQIFYFIHILNFCIAVMLINSLPKLVLPLKKVFWFIIVILFGLFLSDTFFEKYNPANVVDPYRPVILSGEYKKTLSWIGKNTNKKDAFLIYPPEEMSDIPVIALIRPVYLCWALYAEDQGLDYRKRQNEIVSFFNGQTKDIDAQYVFYGPQERRHFPEFSKFNYPIVYKNEFASIYRIE